jgi:hypothetical protein
MWKKLWIIKFVDIEIGAENDTRKWLKIVLDGQESILEKNFSAKSGSNSNKL